MAKKKLEQAAPKKRGRPAKSPEQKAAEKAAKQQAEGAKRQEAAKAVAGHNSADPQLQELFIRSTAQLKKLKETAKSANGKIRAFYKDALRDGFTKDQFETAILCETPEGEAEVRERMAKALQAAQFVGAMLGKNLAHFEEPDRTPASERAYDEGRRASMENKAALPPYAPDTEQFRQYMAGFHAHQETLVKAGMKPVNPPSPAPASEVSSGTAMTRAQYAAQQAAMSAPPADDGTGAESDYEDEENDDEFADRPAAGNA